MWLEFHSRVCGNWRVGTCDSTVRRHYVIFKRWDLMGYPRVVGVYSWKVQPFEFPLESCHQRCDAGSSPYSASCLKLE